MQRNYWTIGYGIAVLGLIPSLFYVGIVPPLLAFLFGSLYVICGLSLIKSTSVLSRLTGILNRIFFPILGVLAMIFDEYLTSPDPYLDGIHTFWYSSSGVCTEGTLCWLVGQGFLTIAGLVSIVLLIIFLIPSKSKKSEGLVSSTGT